MIVEVKRVEHTEATVINRSPIERLMFREFVHGNTQGPAGRCSVSHKETANVSKKVVAALRNTLQHDRRLKLMSEFVCNTSLVIPVYRCAVRIQEILGSTFGKVNAKLRGMGIRTR